ncbi:hypothetical protein PPERSA_02549 [Pseudocohnilembus persalinus]|uniref:Anamorsin homolog n=1 Tax=Pseudocohnilembus persalinus TaxID=266149 RepID=A0A0V0R597_PSEPJ|nr:hypothetical protein PPERSA_02549 [Pseudocohnilembus persalinus]|eukprot:KRX09677.1 hypothetical protein PPERSA_02549 [Pseudocohnilembus persalinus]
MQNIVFAPQSPHDIKFDSNNTIEIIGNTEKLIQNLDYLRDNKFQSFQATLDDPTQLNLKALNQINRILLPEQGKFSAQFKSISEESYKKLIKLLQAVGFENTNMNNPHEVSNQITFYKKQWGQSAKLDSLPQQQQQQQQNQQQQKQQVSGQYNFEKVIEITPEQKQQAPKNPFEQFATGNGESTTIDENELLSKDKIAQPQPQGQPQGGCAPKAKACKNCTCGKKDRPEQTPEEKAKLLKDLENGVVKSNCGNCTLGDAFRCAGCPYKGLPAFKPGEKVKLDLGDNNQDSAFNDGAQNDQIQTQGGTIKFFLVE